MAMGTGRRIANLAVVLLVAALVWAFGGGRHAPAKGPGKPTPAASQGAGASTPASSPKPSTPAPATADGSTAEVGVVADATVVSFGRVVYRGPIDLRPTLARIARGGRIARFRDDGIVFGNRERRLPDKPSGYYREWVHPTNGESGPGAQRVVTGAGGEVFYTGDHYGSFRRVK